MVVCCCHCRCLLAPGPLDLLRLLLPASATSLCSNCDNGQRGGGGVASLRVAACLSPAQLYNDFVKYETARLSQEEFAQDGSTPLKRACRDGDADTLGSLLLELDGSSQQQQPIRASRPKRVSGRTPPPPKEPKEQPGGKLFSLMTMADANQLDDALCVACKYVRRACVRLLLSYHSPTQHVTGPGLSTALLHATLGRAPGRDGVDLDASRAGIVQVVTHGLGLRAACLLIVIMMPR